VVAVTSAARAKAVAWAAVVMVGSDVCVA
jgi:hypothetical protein